MKTFKKKSFAWRSARAVAFGFLMLTDAVHASVIIHQTRVVFPADESEIVVRLTNNDGSPKLVQAWIDDGSRDQDPGEINVPFQIVTPLFRMEPRKGQALRLLKLDNALPRDRESVFWLNVLEVPPKPDLAEEQSYMQFSLRTRIKMFHRPTGLSGNANLAPKQLRWAMAGTQLVVENPTPYFVSIGSAQLVHQDKLIPLAVDMLAPFSSVPVSLEGQPSSVATAGARITYTAINDYGGSQAHEGKLSALSVSLPAQPDAATDEK